MIMRLGVLLLTAVFITVVSMACLAAPATPVAPQMVGQVVWVKGKMEAVSPPPTNKARLLTRRAPIYPGEIIKTDKTGSGQVVFTDGSLLSIKANSELHLAKYQFDKAQPKKDAFSLELIKGGFRTITGAISKAQPEKYQVKTPVATIGVRGTDYTAVCTGLTKCVLSVSINTGIVDIVNAQGKITLAQGSSHLYAQVVSANSAPVSVTSPPAAVQEVVPMEAAVVEPNAVPATSSTGGTTEDTSQQSTSNEESVTTTESSAETTSTEASTEESTTASSTESADESADSTAEAEEGVADIDSSQITTESVSSEQQPSTTEITTGTTSGASSTSDTSLAPGEFCIK